MIQALLSNNPNVRHFVALPLSLFSQNSTKKEIANFEYPVIFKPTDSGGTRGMTILHSREGVEDAYLKALEASIKKEVVVEKYLSQGQLIVIDIAVQNDDVYIASVSIKNNLSSLIIPSKEIIPL